MLLPSLRDADWPNRILEKIETTTVWVLVKMEMIQMQCKGTNLVETSYLIGNKFWWIYQSGSTYVDVDVDVDADSNSDFFFF